VCDKFNEKYKAGSKGMLKKDFIDEPFETAVKWPATVMSLEPVVWLENVSGCYLLDRFTPEK